MKIFTYYQPVEKIDQTNERKLICLWHDNWKKHGFTPIVLNEYFAQKHEGYQTYREIVSAYPSSNPGDYDLSCFMRWMAVAVAGSGDECCIMADYDCFNYEWQALLPGNRKITLYQRQIPSLVSGRAPAFWWMCQQFMKPPKPKIIQGGHVSDMLIIESIMMEDISKFEHSPSVKSYGDKGWETAPAVHYPNSAMGPAKLTPKHLHIPKLRS